MDRKSAVAGAAALVLVVAGGASALVAAQEPMSVSSSTTEAVSQEPTVVIEYVDEAGNPVAAPGSQPTTEVRTFAVDREIIIQSDVEPEVIWVDVVTPVAFSGRSDETTPNKCEYEDGDDHESREHEDDGDECEDEDHERRDYEDDEDDDRDEHEDEEDDD